MSERRSEEPDFDTLQQEIVKLRAEGATFYKQAQEREEELKKLLRQSDLIWLKAAVNQAVERCYLDGNGEVRLYVNHTINTPPPGASLRATFDGKQDFLAHLEVPHVGKFYLVGRFDPKQNHIERALLRIEKFNGQDPLVIAKWLFDLGVSVDPAQVLLIDTAAEVLRLKRESKT